MNNMYYYDGPFGGFGFLGGLIWLLVAVIIIAIIVRTIRGPRRHWYHDHYPGYRHISPALDILKERYVKGEITKEQFDQMRKDIESE